MGVREDLLLIQDDATSAQELIKNAPIALKNNNNNELEEIRRVLRLMYNRSLEAKKRIEDKKPPQATLKAANDGTIIIRDCLLDALSTDTPENLIKKQIVAETQCKAGTGGEWCALNEILKKKISLLNNDEKQNAENNVNKERESDEVLNSGLNVTPEELKTDEVTFFEQTQDDLLSLIGLGSEQTPQQRIESALKAGAVVTLIVLAGWVGLNIARNLGPLGIVKAIK